MHCIDNTNLQIMVDNSKTIRIKQKSQKPYKIHLGLLGITNKIIKNLSKLIFL